MTTATAAAQSSGSLTWAAPPGAARVRTPSAETREPTRPAPMDSLEVSTEESSRNMGVGTKLVWLIAGPAWLWTAATIGIGVAAVATVANDQPSISQTVDTDAQETQAPAQVEEAPQADPAEEYFMW